MEIYELNPHIRYARVHRSPVSLKQELRICYDCRLFFFVNIGGAIMINGEKHSICSNTAVFLPPETKYILNVEFFSEASAIIMDYDLTSDNAHLTSSLGTATVLSFEPAKVPPYRQPPELSGAIVRTVPELLPYLTKCCEYFLYMQPFYREKSSALLKLCLLEMIHIHTQSNRCAVCRDVLIYIQNHYADANLTNISIAKHFGYHPDHLSQLIHRETGQTLHRYLIRYRIQMAKNELLTTQHNIAQIAWKCGFCSSAYFIKMFRQHTGYTPRAYRSLKIHTEL